MRKEGKTRTGDVTVGDFLKHHPKSVDMDTKIDVEEIPTEEIEVMLSTEEFPTSNSQIVKGFVEKVERKKQRRAEKLRALLAELVKNAERQTR